jgi:uncharacterized protein DUF6328
MATRAGSGRRESKAERADRNLSELLQELRVALPGVQVLFAFLLTVPFSQRFTALNAGQEKLYFGVLLCTAISTALLIAPTAHHRILFRMRDKDHLVVIANRYAIAGITVLAVAIMGALVLISDLLFGTTTTVVSAAAVGLVFLTVWYGLPLYRRAHLSRRELTDD